MRLKTGTAEIQYLIEKAVEKFERTNKPIKSKFNAGSYSELAEILSGISNKLPFTAAELHHKKYEDRIITKGKILTDNSAGSYQISGYQIMDARRGNVPNPKSHLIDSCYIYVYNIGRRGFSENPTDSNLVEPDIGPLTYSDPSMQTQLGTKKNRRLIVSVLVGIILILLAGWSYSLLNWHTLKSDMSIIPYLPSLIEKDSIEGVWICYTGSPQARESEPSRYHLVVNNLVQIKAKRNYFTYYRFGSSFDHVGYVQFEAPWLVSVYSHVKNNGDSIKFPRHSLMRLNEPGPFHNAISASWNFDAGQKNQMIGIREVYIKIGKGGHLEKIFDDVESGSCKCKIIRWYKDDKSVVEFRVKNELLDTLKFQNIKELLNEQSILLANPKPGLILSDSLSKTKP